MVDKTKKKGGGEEELDPDAVGAVADDIDTKIDEDEDDEWTDKAVESDEDF